MLTDYFKGTSKKKPGYTRVEGLPLSGVAQSDLFRLSDIPRTIELLEVNTG